MSSQEQELYIHKTNTTSCYLEDELIFKFSSVEFQLRQYMYEDRDRTKSENCERGFKTEK